MKLELRMKYLETISQRYRKASKKSKGKILDELCEVFKYNRKYAIWKIGNMAMEDRTTRRSKRKRPKKYDQQVLDVLEKIWKVANFPWSVRFKEIIRLWLPWIKIRYRITPDMEDKLLSISPSTIDRALKDKKIKLKRRIYGRTKPGTLLRHKIPVRTDNWDVKNPGFFEADLVPHSGSSGHGEFINSLNLTDICTGWVETQSVMGKGKVGVLKAIEIISERLPFDILGIDSDNSEFINNHLWKYCQKEKIQFT